MKRALFFSIFTLASISTHVLAEGLYMTIGGGASNLSDFKYAQDGVHEGTIDINSGYSAELGVGYNFGNDIRTEITYSESWGSDVERDTYSNGRTVNADVYGQRVWIKTKSILATIYKDFSLGSKFTPYIGAGIGSANVDVDGGLYFAPKGVDVDKSSFIYQLKLGGSYSVSKKADIFTELIYRGINDLDFGYPNTHSQAKNLSTTNVHAGIRYKF